jgi:murein L,D-transpeptidase YafK
MDAACTGVLPPTCWYLMSPIIPPMKAINRNDARPHAQGGTPASRKTRTVWLALLVLLCVPGWGQDRSPAATKKADRIVVVKSTRTMTLMSGGQVLKSYKVALGRQPIGAKQRTGDHKTPEGLYVVQFKVPNSRFHRGLYISYPNAADRKRARKMGVNPGGSIEIHGLGDKYDWIGAMHRQMDWTDGCIAVTNEEIDEIWPLVAAGTPVEIRP